jgi:polyadenylate-binding protein
LYIKNLPDGTIEDVKKRVSEIFGQFGEITSTALKVDSNIKKTFGFVNYNTHEEAESALKSLNGSDPFGNFKSPLY